MKKSLFLLLFVLSCRDINVEKIKLFASQVSEDRISDTITKLSSLETRMMNTKTGVEAANIIVNKVKECAVGSNKNWSVQTFNHKKENMPDWIQPSVIAEIRGSESPEEIVVIGGHLDSVNWNKSIQHYFTAQTPAPGADDDASGTATALEAFCVMLKNPEIPKKSIQFMAYSAEELGLFGSMDIAKTYKSMDKKVIGVMQLDMVLWPNKDEAIYFITDNTNPSLTRYVEEISRVLGYKVDETECGYRCSDHASWNKYGYKTVFPFEAGFGQDNPYIHSEKDTISNAGGTKEALKFGQIAVAFLYGLAY